MNFLKPQQTFLESEAAIHWRAVSASKEFQTACGIALSEYCARQQSGTRDAVEATKAFFKQQGAREAFEVLATLGDVREPRSKPTMTALEKV